MSGRSPVGCLMAIAWATHAAEAWAELPVAQTPNDHMRKEIDRLILALDRMNSGEWSRMANGVIDSLSPEDVNALSRALIRKLYGDMVWQAVEFGANANEFMDSAARRNGATMNATGGSGGLGAADVIQATKKWAVRGWGVVKEALVGKESGRKDDIGECFMSR